MESESACFPGFFRLDSLPAGGVLLDKGWTFHPADGSQWARQGYNAPGEKPINPLLSLYRLPIIKKAPFPACNIAGIVLPLTAPVHYRHALSR